MGSVDQTASRMVRPGPQPSLPGSAYLLVVENDSSSIVHLPRSGAIDRPTSEAAFPGHIGSCSAAIRIGDRLRIVDLRATTVRR
jgi:hypothetical protein